MQYIINHLKRKGLIRGSSISISIINRTSDSKLRDIALELSHLPTTTPSIDRELATHSASLSLSGHRMPCSSLGCRKNKAEHLARFAALYSDRVYVPNLFARYQHAEHSDTETLRESLSDDIRIALLYRPLSQKGLVAFYDNEEGICEHCLAASFGGPEAPIKFDEACYNIVRAYRDNLSVTYERVGDQHIFLCEAPSPYLEHGTAVMMESAPSALSSRPRLSSRAARGAQVPIRKYLLPKIGLAELFADEIIRNVVLSLYATYSRGTSMVTESPLHGEVLTTLNEKSSSRRARTNRAISRHLDVLVPYAEDVSIRDLVHLRERAGDSFAAFRAAISRAVSNAAQEDELDEATAHELFQDVIRPRLDQLDQKVHAAKKDLASSLAKSTTYTVGALSFGLFTGLFPADITSIASYLGLSKGASDTLDAIRRFARDRRDLQQDDVYFLWRVRHISRRDSRYKK